MPTDVQRRFEALFENGVEWKPIALAARRVWTLTGIAAATPLLVLVIVVLAVAGGIAGIVAGVAIVGSVLWLIRRLVVRRHRSWGYSVHEDELMLRRGLLIRRLTIVPIGRLQFIDIQQGPLDRWLDVANLQLHTAAAASDAKIPMLSLDDANRLRDELIERGAGRSGGT
jgi:membrane protein YdbS with pleckstrin-like domain